MLRFLRSMRARWRHPSKPRPFPRFRVNWGDGSKPSTVTARDDHVHTYAANGTYDVEIKGLLDE